MLLIVELKDLADLHALVAVAEHFKLLILGCDDQVFAILGVYNDASCAQVELNARGKVVEVLEDELMLEEQF